jgi:hypothetical protein
MLILTATDFNRRVLRLFKLASRARASSQQSLDVDLRLYRLTVAP